jgi:uncharacterized protein
MLDFQRYQIAFTAHIRDPKNNPKPPRVRDSRMAIYREIVFNNLVGSVSACFPVCKSISGQRAWQQLVRRFFTEHQATTPLFREIPQQFLHFIAGLEELPEYYRQLAHYEWVELAVSSMPDNPNVRSAKPDLLDSTPALAPHMLLAYDYAVHTISKQHKPTGEVKTYILMFRTTDFQVKFIELNAMTYELLKLLETRTLTGRQALLEIAKNLNHPEPEMIVQFGQQILEDLQQQGAIYHQN